jgi:Domain of unknown function (DUF4160)
MVRVVASGRFSVYVFAEEGQPHHLPHCHVRWSDGQAVVELPSRRRRSGHALPAAARQLLEDHAAEIEAAWNRLNPGRPIG